METKSFDFIITGAGPAGLTAAMYAARNGLLTLTIDSSFAGGQATQIYNLENYPGIFPAVNGFDFADTLRKQAESFGAKIIQAHPSSVAKEEDGTFTVTTSKNIYKAPCLLIATGAEHKKAGIKGEDTFKGKGVSYCATCDGPLFKNRHIVVMGGGDSACSEALYLATLTDKVTVIHRRKTFRAQKTLAEKVLSNKNITVKFNTEIQEICGDSKVSSVILKDKNGNTQTLECDAVFIFAGMTAQTELFDFVKKDEGGWIITNEDMQTSVKNLLAAGDVRSKHLRQIVTACSDGAVAAVKAGEIIRSLKNEVYK
ncbi:MAG: FAD-dependent oxidoreductase [Treponema sp.]|nr:FAD-dependent oxidoreductase [Treponema sp.]